jgi:hypothetical protein
MSEDVFRRVVAFGIVVLWVLVVATILVIGDRLQGINERLTTIEKQSKPIEKSE